MKYTKEFILSRMKPTFAPQIPEGLMSSFVNQQRAWIHFSNGASISVVEEMDYYMPSFFSSASNEPKEMKYEFMMNSSFHNTYIPFSFNNDEINEVYGDPQRYCTLEQMIDFLNLVENEPVIIAKQYQSIHAQYQKTFQFIENDQLENFKKDLPNLDKNIIDFVKNLDEKEMIHNFFHHDFAKELKEINNIKEQIFYANLVMKVIENDSLNFLEPIFSKMDKDFTSFVFHYFIEQQGINERLSNYVLQTPNIELFQLLKNDTIYDVQPHVEYLNQNYPHLSNKPWFEKIKLEFNLEDKNSKKSRNKL